MATVTVSLPDELMAIVEADARSKGYETASEYVLALIQEARRQAARKQRVDTLLLEGLESGEATPLTHADFEEIRRGVHERHASRSAEGAGSGTCGTTDNDALPPKLT